MSKGCLYLLHFDSPVPRRNGGARHYLGYTNSLHRRLEEHSHGSGARLLAVCVERGITWRHVRTWPNCTRTDERRLKNRHNHARLCPICRGEK